MEEVKKEVATGPKNVKFILDRVRIEQEKTIANILAVVKKKPYPSKNTTQLATFVHALFQTAPYIKRPHLKKEVEKQAKKEAQAREDKREIETAMRNGVKPLPMPPSPHRKAVRSPVAVEIVQPKALSQPKLTAPAGFPVLNQSPAEAKLPDLPASPTEPKPAPKLKVPELTVPPPPSAQEPMQKREYVVSLYSTPIGIYVAPDENTYKVTYRVIEPVIDNNVLTLTKEMIKKDFQKNYKILDDEKYMQETVEKATKKVNVQFTADYPRKIKYFLKRDLSGFRRLDPMMQDTNVQAIYVDGINKPVVVEFKDRAEKIQSNVIFTDAKDLNILITKLAKVTNNEVSDTKPILDTIFQGFKIQATKGVGGATSKLIIKKVMF